MPNLTPRRLTLNIPIIVLWVASVGVGVFGYFFLQAGNAAQADFYNTGGSDYLQYLNLQTQSTIGGMLLTAGIVGVFIALATHARNWAAAATAAAQNQAAYDDLFGRDLDEEDDDDDDDGFEAVGLEARDEEPVAAAPVTAAPAATESAPVDAEAAPEPETPKDSTDRA
ncbi:hypothetical protein [Agromyces bauzanensis]